MKEIIAAIVIVLFCYIIGEHGCKQDSFSNKHDDDWQIPIYLLDP